MDVANDQSFNAILRVVPSPHSITSPVFTTPAPPPFNPISMAPDNYY